MLKYRIFVFSPLLEACSKPSALKREGTIRLEYVNLAVHKHCADTVVCTCGYLGFFSSCLQAKPKPDEEVKPLKEPDIKPQKDSGCQIS